jgi:hypothetical protein
MNNVKSVATEMTVLGWITGFEGIFQKGIGFFRGICKQGMALQLIRNIGERQVSVSGEKEICMYV